MEVILALDIGSSSVRCTAYSKNGTSVMSLPGNSCNISFRSVKPNSGKISLLFGKGTLMDAVDESVSSVLRKLRGLKQSFQVVGVGFSSFVMNLIAVDAQGKFFDEEASITYACNSPEVVNECKQIREELGTEGLEELYQNTGAPIHSAYALPQLRQLYKSYPEIVRKTFMWQSIASLCLCRWTGRNYLPISYSEASWTGLLNFRDCAYEVGATELLPPGCRDSLPPLADFCETLPGIPEFLANSQPNKYWNEWPELRDTPLFLGLGDGACANIGSKCSTASRIAVTIGTSAAARVCLNQAMGESRSLKVPKGLFCYRIDTSHVLLGGALTDGGSVVEWAENFLNLKTKEAFLECLTKTEDLARTDYSGVDTKTTTLSMIPFLSGERSTGFRDGATGAVMGLTRDTTPAHFLKACLESVALRIRCILQLIVEARNVDEPPCVVVSGKALESNALWRQMIADSSGLKVVLDKETYEGTSRGVARLISVALTTGKEQGKSGLLCEEEIGAHKTSEPNPDAHEYFDNAALAQQRYIEAISPLYNS